MKMTLKDDFVDLIATRICCSTREVFFFFFLPFYFSGFHCVYHAKRLLIFFIFNVKIFLSLNVSECVLVSVCVHVCVCVVCVPEEIILNEPCGRKVVKKKKNDRIEWSASDTSGDDRPVSDNMK